MLYNTACYWKKALVCSSCQPIDRRRRSPERGTGPRPLHWQGPMSIVLFACCHESYASSPLLCLPLSENVPQISTCPRLSKTHLSCTSHSIGYVMWGVAGIPAQAGWVQHSLSTHARPPLSTVYLPPPPFTGTPSACHAQAAPHQRAWLHPSAAGLRSGPGLPANTPWLSPGRA